MDSPRKNAKNAKNDVSMTTDDIYVFYAFFCGKKKRPVISFQFSVISNGGKADGDGSISSSQQGISNNQVDGERRVEAASSRFESRGWKPRLRTAHGTRRRINIQQPARNLQ